MGKVFPGLHAPLASELIRAFGLQNAVETGSYFGLGALHLAALCSKVWSIEADPSLVAFCRATYKQVHNLSFLHGDSPFVLETLLPQLEGPSLIVLDAHWFSSSANASFQFKEQCPILRELEAINCHLQFRDSSVIMIDDCQMFCRAKKLPYDVRQFPSIFTVSKIAASIITLSETEVVDDVLISGPTGVTSIVEAYLERRASVGTP